MAGGHYFKQYILFVFNEEYFNFFILFMYSVLVLILFCVIFQY